MGRQGDFLFIPFFFFSNCHFNPEQVCQARLTVVDHSLAQQYPPPPQVSLCPLYSISFLTIFLLQHLTIFPFWLYQGGDFELMEDGNGTMMDYQVLTVDDYLLIKQIAFSLTEENICWSWFFCHEIVCTMDLFFLLSASYEGSYWICWIVMLWCIHTNCNNFLTVVISWLNNIGLC